MHALVEVFLTNGNGVAYAAEPIYIELIQDFDTVQAAIALRAFTDDAIANRLQFPRPARKWNELLDLLAPKLTRRADRELLTAVRAFHGPLDQMAQDAEIQRVLHPDGSEEKSDRGSRR